jgi:basic amino acid/polyamine antiporter, APA family
MAELKKSLGYGTIIALSVTSVLGTGIFVGPAIAASYSGPASIISWLLLAGVAIYVSMCFGELAGMFPNAGGVYEYAKRSYGHFPSFMIGWTTWLVSNITACLMVVAAMQYLVPLLSRAAHHFLAESVKPGVLALVSNDMFEIFLAASIIIIFNYIAYRGIEASSVLLIFFAIVTVGVILSLVIPGLGHIDLNNFQPFFVASPIMLVISIFFIMETFFGWESVTFLAEETKNAEKIIPRSLIITTVIVTLLGIATAFVMLGMVNWQELSRMEAPFESLSGRFYTGWKQDLVALGIVVALFGAAAGSVVSSPRLLLALARDKLFINKLSDIHPVHQSPYKAIIFQTIITVIVIFIGFGAYKKILELLVPMALMMYISVLLAVPILRIKHPEMARPFRVPFGKIGPVIISLAYAATIIIWMQNDPQNIQLFKLILSFIGFGLPIYLLLLFHYDPDVVVKLNDYFAYISLMFERMLIPKRIMHEIFNHLGSLRDKKVLEFGCGVGTITTEISRRVGHDGHVFATDLSHSSVRIAQRRTERTGYTNVSFIHDIHQVNRVHHAVPEVDFVVSVGMLGYIQDINKVLAEMNRILPEGGRIFFVDYIDLFKIIPNVSWLSQHESLKALFRQNGFSVRVEKVKGNLWNYIFVYGIKSSEQVPFI